MDTFLNTHDLAKLNKMNINSLKFIIKNELKAVINNLLTLKKKTPGLGGFNVQSC